MPRLPLVSRLPLALSLLTLALLAPTAAAQNERPAPVKTSTQTCGAYTLKLSENGFGDPEDRVSLVRGGTTYATVSDIAVSVDWCRDVTGDGVPEVLLAGFSGGAHCCFTHTLYSLSTPPRKLLSVFSAHSETITPRQLDGKGPLELLVSDWRFAYAYGLSFAESVPLLNVYAYVGGQYVDRSRAFPGTLRGFLTRQVTNQTGGGEVLADYATLLAIGKSGEAQAFVQGLPARFRAWLTNYGPDIRHAMNDYGLSDWPLRAGAPFSAARMGLGGSFSAPNQREYLGMVGGGTQATLRLYRAQGAQVVAGPALMTVPARQPDPYYLDTAWAPVATVRRATGRDDLLVRDERSGGMRYVAYRVSPGRLTELQDDPLAVTARMLGDLSTLSKHVGASFTQTTPPRTAAQRAEVQRRIDVAAARAQPWLNLAANADIPARALGSLTFSGLDLTVDRPDQARVVAPISLGLNDARTNSEDIEGERYTLTVNLVRSARGWAVKDWTLDERGGELYEEE
ncbi:hypothetical protein [Deinococcus arcticus]|uniref:Lipoprotein n=1 Tax=Deinococcus arcticus TaxID=2136176 RepID=A0A2T3W5P0_9DEIO|nr:hypothetical protein [Deinococcus arcticus]PTA67104.1 hypothetical protein C8263_14400 [Deinococcus arcticus]